MRIKHRSKGEAIPNKQSKDSFFGGAWALVLFIFTYTALSLETLFAEDPQTLDEKWDLTADTDKGRFKVCLYQPLYFLICNWSSYPNPKPASLNADYFAQVPLTLNSVEFKFQISFKTKILNDFLAGIGGRIILITDYQD